MIDTEPFSELVAVRGIAYPAHVKLRHLLVSGPPRSGKSTLVAALGGWPEEGYLDLGAKSWWLNRLLTFRPREVHFGFPFVGFNESHAVFDEEWMANPTPIDYPRIHLPPPKRRFYQVDWRHRFVFEFLIPPPADLCRIGRDRARKGTHPVDRNLTEANVTRQHAVYEDLAQLLNDAGFQVIVRRAYGGAPLKIRKTVGEAAPGADDRRDRTHSSAPNAPPGAR